MTIHYDIEKINQLLSDFYQATGINMDLRKADFSFINQKSFWETKCYCKAIQQTEKGRAACRFSDECLFKKSRESKGLEMQRCHGGLTDVAEPILYGDEILGYLIFGQIRTEGDFSEIRDYLASLGLDPEEMEQYYNEVAVFSPEKIRSLANIAKILMKHILLENILRPDFNENIQKAVQYIEENAEKEISIHALSQKANLSKSALYRGFHRSFGCTVGEYIHKRRIERAKGLLCRTDLSIEEIGQRVGYISGSYFSKIFKKEMGRSPLQYKKEKREQKE